MTSPYDPQQGQPPLPPSVDDTVISYGATVPDPTPPPAPPRRSRLGLFAACSAVGSLLVLTGGIGLTYAVWGPGSYPDAPLAQDATADPDGEGDGDGDGDTLAEVEPEDEPSLGSSSVNPPLDDKYRPAAEMDEKKGPDLAPVSWDYFQDNDNTVNDYDVRLTARHDLDCKSLPDIPALTKDVHDSCERGFEVRSISGEGKPVALDMIVVEVGSEDKATEIDDAFLAARDKGSGAAADTSGAADEELHAPPPPGYEDAYAGLDKGYAGGAVLSTLEAVVVIIPSDASAAQSPEMAELAKATAFVVTDHQLAESFK